MARTVKKRIMLVALLLGTLATIVLGVGWVLSRPEPLTQAVFEQQIPADYTVDINNGQRIYDVGGCISCHRPPEDNDRDIILPLGGAALVTPIGTFYPPNLTPDLETGLGAWSRLDFVNAMMRGLNKDGQHFIPAFPYVSYSRIKLTDLLDLQAYLARLPAVYAPYKNNTLPHIVEFLVRRLMGLWNRFALLPPLLDDPTHDALWNRGRYLVSGAGHCGECHTPRNFVMISKMNFWLSGGPHPEGRGRVPSLRNLVKNDRYKDVADLAMALKSGEALGYDHLSSGGMGEVQSNLSKLPDEDLLAIATYLVDLKE